MQFAYKAFYRVFDYFSYVPIPHDAGDFSLMDRRVVKAILQFPERDLFLRGVRAFAGFKQTGVDYVRPERMFGRTHQQPAQEHRLGQEGHPQLQQHAAEYAHVRGGRLLLGLSGILAIAPGRRQAALPELAPAGLHDDPGADPVLRLAQLLRRSASWASTSPRSSRRSSGGPISSGGA